MKQSSQRKRRRTSPAWFLVIGVLLAILLALIAWAVLQEPTCSGGVCPEPDTTPPPPSSQVIATEPVQTQPTTLPPTTPPPTQPVSQPMRVVTQTSILSEPRQDAASIRALSIGDTVEVIGLEDSWYQLSPAGYLPEHTLRSPGEYLIVIDPGHQGKGNSEKEPIGPGASEKKAKVSSGTQGVATGIPEYKLTLEVSLKLRDALEAKGYQVIMTRTEHDVNISNAQRAQIANELYADVFIRVHANGDANSNTKGIMTLCQTPENPYNAHLYDLSCQLSTLVLDEMVAATGGKRQFVWETDTMSGINWCQVPVTIVEMGYMSNPEEDRLMASEPYQQKLITGMVGGIEAYLQELAG